MRQKIAIAVALVVVGLLAGSPAVAQEAAPPSLKEQIEAQYKLAKLGRLSGEITVTEPGTLLAIQQAGIRGVPLGDLTMAPAIYKDGVLHPPNKKSSFTNSIFQAATHPTSETSGKDFRPFPVGDKVYVSKLDVNMKNDRIVFIIVECAECNGASGPSPYKAAVSFQFAKGYLETANVPDVEDTIAKVIRLDTATAVAQPAQDSQAGQDQQPKAPPQATPTVNLGQTTDQVKAILGQPDKTVDLGSKQIYVYKDLKVTFLDGKVSDVQ